MRRVLREVADWLAHVLGPRRAVEADHVDPEPFKGGHRARDVGAEQHAAADVEGDLRLDGDAAADLGEEALESSDGRLDLENILRRLDEQDVDAPLDEGAGLLVEVLDQLVEGDGREGGVAAGGEHPGRSDRAGDVAGVLGGREFVAGCAGEAGRGDVELVRFLSDPPFGESAGRGLEGAGLDDVAPDGEEGLVDAADDVRAGQDQVVIAPFQRLPAEIIGGEVVALNVGPHGAVEDQDVVREGFEIGCRHGHKNQMPGR